MRKTWREGEGEKETRFVWIWLDNPPPLMAEGSFFLHRKYDEIRWIIIYTSNCSRMNLPAMALAKCLLTSSIKSIILALKNKVIQLLENCEFRFRWTPEESLNYLLGIRSWSGLGAPSSKSLIGDVSLKKLCEKFRYRLFLIYPFNGRSTN